MIRFAVVSGAFVLLLAPAAVAETPAELPDVAPEQQAAVAIAPPPAPSGPDEVRARPGPLQATVPSRFTDTPLTINLVVGLGTPVGELGFIAEYSIVDRFAVGLGAGMNLGGAQAAALLRLRPILMESKSVAQAIDLVGAFATGEYTYPFTCSDSGCWDEQAYWAQGGLDYELSWSGFHLATGLGIAVLAAASGVHEIVADGSPRPVPRVYPTAHLTVGFGI